MKFSIVTPSYNQAEFIQDTIDGVLNQTYSDFEYIIVDGGSMDGTKEILASYREKISKIIIEPDNGQADAINKGFTFATGEIFSYLNSDDYYFHGTLEKVAEVFHDNPNIDVVYGNCVFTDDMGQFICYFSEISDYDRVRLLNNTDHIMQPATFWRRDVFDKFGPFDKDLHYGFDWAFWCELAEKHCGFLRINDVLAANRVYASTKTSSGSLRRLNEIRKINYKYKTKILPHAYFGFSHEEYRSKKSKNVGDYFRILFYKLLSYQNIIFHIINYNNKIINGVLPRSNKLEKKARLKLPRLNYNHLHISLRAPEIINQSVLVFLNDEFVGEYYFKCGQVYIDFDIGKELKDIDVQFEFYHEYSYMSNLITRAMFFYKPTLISATLCEFKMS